MSPEKLTVDERLIRLETKVDNIADTVEEIKENHLWHIRWLLALLTITIVPLLLKVVNII